MSRHDVTDWEWKSIRVYLPSERTGKAGRPWVSHRKVVSGILWILHVGGSWRDLPVEYGKWSTVYSRFRRWCRSGLWNRIMRSLLRKLDAQGKIDRQLWCVDGTLVRGHRSAAGAVESARKKADNQALGRSQGGFGTKLHLLTDSRGVLLAVTATPGQRHEAPEFPNMMMQVELSIHRLAKRPKQLAGDKGYSSNKIRTWLLEKNIKPIIPTKSNEAKHPFNKRTYKKRNIVERFIGWLKDHRRLATRYEKNADSFLAFIKIAIIRKLLKLI